MPLLKLKHPERLFETPTIIAYMLSLFLFERLNPLLLKWIGYYDIKAIHLIWMFPLGFILSISVFCGIVVPNILAFRKVWDILNPQRHS